MKVAGTVSFSSHNYLKFSITFNGVNLQKGNVFISVFLVYIAIEIIVALLRY